MIRLNDYINEKLKINSKTAIYKYLPKDCNELEAILEEKLNNSKDGVIDVSDIDTSNVITLDRLFEFDTEHKITEIKGLNFWNVSNCDDFTATFKDLLITNIDISDWDMSNAKRLAFMFMNCINIESVGDLSKWNTDKVRDTKFMFHKCRNLTNIGDISNWNIFNLQECNMMFNDCEKLHLDISKWKLKDKGPNIYMVGIKTCAPNIKLE